MRRYGMLRRMNKDHSITNQQWETCKQYFNYSCAYCGISEEKAKLEQGHNLHKEHAMNNGSDGIENCLPSCRKCNSKKWTNNYIDWYTTENPIYDQERYNKIYRWLNEEVNINTLI